MKIYKAYKFYDGNYDDPQAVYVGNCDRAIQIFNDLVRGECKNVTYGKLNEEEFREALKKIEYGQLNEQMNLYVENILS